MHRETAPVHDAVAHRPDPAKAAEACRALILASLNPPGARQSFENALTLAVKAFGLPADYIETEGGRWQ